MYILLVNLGQSYVPSVFQDQAYPWKDLKYDDGMAWTHFPHYSSFVQDTDSQRKGQ